MLKPDASYHVNTIGRCCIEELLTGSICIPGTNCVSTEILDVGYVGCDISSRETRTDCFDGIRIAIDLELPVALDTNNFDDLRSSILRSCGIIWLNWIIRLWLGGI